MSTTKRAKLTKTIIETLATERERTGITYAQLLKQSEGAPDDLTERHIYIWLSKSKTARADHLQFVLEAYAALPTVKDAASLDALEIPRPHRSERLVPTKRPLGPFIEITIEMRTAMKSEMVRSGIRQTTIMSMIPPEFSQISLQMIRGWISGRTAKVRPAYWECVMKVLRELPDSRT